MTQTLRRQRRADRRTLRRIVRQRAAANRTVASLRRGRSLATHLLVAGVADAETVKGAASGLRTVAKRIGVEPVKVVRSHRTVDGKQSRTRATHHYTTAQVARIAAAYKPRKATYRDARDLLLAASGPAVTVRQTVRARHSAITSGRQLAAA